jgi:hypothetical protein
VAEIMAKVIKRVESHSSDIPASEITNINLEFGRHSKVLQIGLADLEGARVIDRRDFDHALRTGLGDDDDLFRSVKDLIASSMPERRRNGPIYVSTLFLWNP